MTMKRHSIHMLALTVMVTAFAGFAGAAQATPVPTAPKRRAPPCSAI